MRQHTNEQAWHNLYENQQALINELFEALTEARHWMAKAPHSEEYVKAAFKVDAALAKVKPNEPV